MTAAVTGKNEIRAYLWAINEARKKRVSEVDLMSGKNPLSFLRRIERQWAERIPSLEQIQGQIVVAVERKLQRVFNDEVSLTPIRGSGPTTT